MPKPRRQRLIARFIGAAGVRTQGDLEAMLAQAGEAVTQGTLSRDLRELGVRKGPGGYELPAPGASDVRSPGPSVEPPRSILGGLVLEVLPAGTLVVVKTDAGHAQAVAIELDRSPPAGVVGCVAGDDTILVAARSVAGARSVARAIARRAGLP